MALKEVARPSNAGPNWKPFTSSLPELDFSNLPPSPNQSFDTQPDFTYADLHACSVVMGERHDCAIIATCIVTDYPYPRIHEMYRLVGRRHRCYTPWVYMVGVLAQLGYKLQDVTKFYDPSSLRTIVPQLPNKGNFLVGSRKHVSAVRNGVMEDWAVERKMYVKEVFQVVDRDAPPQLTPPQRPHRHVVINFTSPTKAVHTIADLFLNDICKQTDWPDPDRGGISSLPHTRRYWSTFRAKVIAECVANGINKTTAAVQVGKWMAGKGLELRYLP